MVSDLSPGSPSMYVFPDASPPQWGTWIASPAHTSTSDGLSPPSSPHTLYSATFDDVDFPEAYSPVCYDPGDDDDDDDCNWHSDHDGDDDDDDDDDDIEAHILSGSMNEDKNNEHVSICITF